MNVEDKLRYSRVSDILSLLTLMQSKVLGITLTDIQNELPKDSEMLFCAYLLKLMK